MNASTILERVCVEIESITSTIDDSAQLTARLKNAASIRRKMRRLHGARVLDSIGVRVIVRDRTQCYRLILQLHRHFRPVVDEYDDYIVCPKSNGYQSLHTILLTEDGVPFEVQVRTREMHRRAESGSASHSTYKLC